MAQVSVSEYLAIRKVKRLSSIRILNTHVGAQKTYRIFHLHCSTPWRGMPLCMAGATLLWPRSGGTFPTKLIQRRSALAWLSADSSGSSTTVFESINQPERQRQVGSGEAFTYVFPLKTLQAAHANDVRITLYLFRARSGPSTGDITKVFMNSPQQADDGEYFYGALPPPSPPAK